MRISLPILTVFLLAVMVTVTVGQNRTERVERENESNFARKQAFGIGLSVGLHQFTGDVQDKDGGFFAGAENNLLFGGNIVAKYRIGSLKNIGSLHLLGRAGYHPMDGTLNEDGSSYEFTNDAIVASVGLQLELLPQSDVRPFANAGAGFLFYDPKVTTSGRWDKKYTDNLAEQDGSTSTFAIPIDLGLIFTISSKLDVMAYVNKTLAFSDNLDGWESNINDNWQSFNVGFVYYFGGTKEKVIVKETPPPPPVKKDTDGDGLYDEDEKTTYKTDHTDKDTDDDGLQDGEEVKTHKTDPLNPDTDGDKLKDGDEVKTHKTNPLNPDTDGDKCNDGQEVITMKTKPLVRDTDGDGLQDCEEVTKYKTNPLIVDTDGDGANDGREIAAGTDPLVKDVLEMTGDKNIVLEGINFETAKANILPESVPILTKAANTLKVNDKIRVEIQGHTDDRGSNRSNQRLSEARANSVRDWLIQNGINAGRLTAIGLGEDQPAVPNNTAENRAKNRRIEFKILK